MKRILLLLLSVVIIGSASVIFADEPKVTIHYEDGSQFEIISPEGSRVILDVYDPSLLSRPAASQDILLTTCGNNYHTSLEFLRSFPGRQLYIKAETLTAEGVKITGIPSSYNDYLDFSPQGVTNCIYVIETAGLRIVDFGDVGQGEFTPEQLAAIGRPDIALIQFFNHIYNIDISHPKTFNLMDQVKPKLVIPTQLDDQTARYGGRKWQGYYAGNTLTIGKSDLNDQTKFLMLGVNGKLGKAMKIAAKWPGK